MSGTQLTPLEGLSILVAEDSPDNQLLIRFILRAEGARVEIVPDGAAAVHRAFEETFDLIVMDMHMPVLDGYEATRQLRARGYKKPIIALTASFQREERQLSLEMGCTAQLTKPFRRSDLSALITACIRGENPPK